MPWPTGYTTPAYLREHDLVLADALAGAQQEQRTNHTVEIARPHESIAERDRELAQHRAALEAGAGPALSTTWMKEIRANARPPRSSSQLGTTPLSTSNSGQSAHTCLSPVHCSPGKWSNSVMIQAAT
ncbi:hypothetical protein GCM10007147_25590 [Nocardiopsis kunsanensis]|uniref:Uncharacterized protein n=1 Tax=Nocardiopsis kunsanensis TaxID=141693 RepID=A0A919CIV3_9ACTN|nr:hypothetical protein GCM10007147_25590 [Nocardiopsis kunsanensis]